MDEVTEVTDVSMQAKENLFEPMIPEARSALRRLMLNSSNEKIVRETAESVLDRAGQTKKVEDRVQPVVNISESHVQLLVQASKEAFNEE